MPAEAWARESPLSAMEVCYFAGVTQDAATGLDDIRREIVALEARRDELATRLAALREDDEDGEKPKRATKKKKQKKTVSPPPEPIEWRPRNFKAALVVFLVVGVFLLLFSDKVMMWVVAAVFVLIVGSQLAWPPRLSFSERGLVVRGFLTPHDYRWTEVSDFRVSTKSHTVEVKTKEGWQTHAYTTLSEEDRLKADACARAWIDAARAGAAKDSEGKRQRKRSKRKKRRRRDADGLPG